MARYATIVGSCRDHTGYPFDVREIRPTGLGFPILVGWPEGVRGKGMGGPQVILTKDLRKYLLDTFLSRGEALRTLPIGGSTLKRLRRVIGLDYYAEVSAWWIEKAPELASGTLTNFAERYGLDLSTVSEWNQRLFGKRLRHANWWKTPDVQALLLSGDPAWLIASKLDIAEGSVRRLRWLSRQSDVPQTSRNYILYKPIDSAHN